MPTFIDSLNIWAATQSLPQQMVDARQTIADLEGLPTLGAINNVVVLGMGGSGIGGDVLNAIASPIASVPVIVSKNYELPAFVGSNSLVLVSSFSGNTEETLEAAVEAKQRGATLIALTSGGKVASLAEEWGIACAAIPSTIPQPRVAIGAGAVMPIAILDRLGLLTGGAKLVDQAIDQVTRRRDELWSNIESNVATGVAEQIFGTMPHIHGGGVLGAAAALRWKCQINENPKIPAFSAAQPELSHNEVAGWGDLEDLTQRALSLVQLRHDYEHAQVKRRQAFAADIVKPKVKALVQVHAAGDGPLAQLMDLVLIGDVASLQLAAMAGIDPGPVAVLVGLKQALAR
jgi:glucose/mannose-6-phosphate isomerase